MDKPIIAFIDDLQWGDGDSAVALGQILQGEGSPVMLLLGSYRRDEAEGSPFLAQWKSSIGTSSHVRQETVSVGPLTKMQCVKMVVDRVGIDNAVVREKADEIYQSTGGNPYFLEQLIDCFDVDKGSFHSAPLDEVIQSKLATLTADAEPLLQAISVCGEAAFVKEISLATEIDDAYGTLIRMRNERLIRLVGADDQQKVDTYHDKIRETVLELVDADAQRRIHQNLGEAIETSNELNLEVVMDSMQKNQGTAAVWLDRIFDLSYHFDRAGNHQRALLYSTLAAEHATRQFALKIARDRYIVAERNQEYTTQELKTRIALGHGSTLIAMARYDEAYRILDGGIEASSDEREKLKLRSKQADILYKQGNISESITRIDAMLGELGISVPRTASQATVRSFGLIAKILLWNCIPPRFRKSSGSWHTAQALELLTLLLPALYYNQPWKMTWAGIYQYHLAKKRNVKGRAWCLANLFLGLPLGVVLRADRLSSRFCLRARQLSHELGDIRVQADVDYFFAWCLSGVGRFEEAIEHILAASDSYDRIGDEWRKTYARALQAWNEARLGRAVGAAKHASFAFERAVRSQQDRLAQTVMEPWSASLLGRIPFQAKRGCFKAVLDDRSTTVELLLSEYWSKRAEGETEQALALAEHAIEQIDKYRLCNFTTLLSFPILAQAVREHAADQNGKDREKLQGRQFRAAKCALQKTKRDRLARPFALREWGLALAEQGRRRAAWRALHKSCRLAQDQHAELEYALSLLALANLGEKLGRSEAKQQLDEAYQRIAEYDALIDGITS